MATKKKTTIQKKPKAGKKTVTQRKTTQRSSGGNVSQTQSVIIHQPVRRVYSKSRGKVSAPAPVASTVFVPQYLPQAPSNNWNIKDVLDYIKAPAPVSNAPVLSTSAIGGSLPMNIPLPKKKIQHIPVEEAIPLTTPVKKNVTISKEPAIRRAENISMSMEDTDVPLPINKSVSEKALKEKINQMGERMSMGMEDVSIPLPVNKTVSEKTLKEKLRQMSERSSMGMEDSDASRPINKSVSKKALKEKINQMGERTSMGMEDVSVSMPINKTVSEKALKQKLRQMRERISINNQPLPFEEAFPSTTPVTKNVTISKPESEEEPEYNTWRPVNPLKRSKSLDERTPSLFSLIPEEEDPMMTLGGRPGRNVEYTLDEAFTIIAHHTNDTLASVRRKYQNELKMDKALKIKGTAGRWRTKAKDIQFNKKIEQL